MYLRCFCIYDSKAEAYLPPFFMKSKGEAIRAVISTVNDPQSNFHKYAEDFVLFELGHWQEDNATFSLLPAPHSLGVLCEFKKQAKLESE